MSVSLRDVAKSAKVSVGTVSNVLNRPEIVAEKTLNRVRETIKELGFVPNGFARQLRFGNSRTIGLIVPDVSNPFFTEVARGVEDGANKRDYAVFLCNSDESIAKEERYINVLIEQQVRGVLFSPSAKRSLAQKTAVGIVGSSRIAFAASSPCAEFINEPLMVSIFTLPALAAFATPMPRSATCGILSGPQTQAIL